MTNYTGNANHITSHLLDSVHFYIRPKCLLNLHSQISDSFHITEYSTGHNYTWNGSLFQHMDRSQILLNWCLMWMVKQDCDSIMCNLPGMFQAGRIINNMPKILVQSIYLLLVPIPEVFNKISPKKYIALRHSIFNTHTHTHTKYAGL